MICLIVKHFGHIFDFVIQIWPEQKRLRAQHARMLHTGQPTHVYMLHIKIQLILRADFIFEVKNTFYGNIPPPQLTCIGLCAHVLCLKRARRSSNVYFDLENEISNLNYRSTCKIHFVSDTFCKCSQLLITCKNVPGWPSWLWAHARWVQVKVFKLDFKG